jgi:hypothetical protein
LALIKFIVSKKIKLLWGVRLGTDSAAIFKKFGLKAFLLDRSIYLASRLLFFKSIDWLTLSLDDVGEGYLAIPKGHQAKFSNIQEMKHFVGKEYQLEYQFIKEAFAKGDIPYTITKDSRLCSYGWYAKAPNEIYPGIKFIIPERHIYMYKGFTHPEHRGMRLHAINMARALRELNNSSAHSFLSFVETQNFASLRSCYRLGYQKSGRSILFEILGKTFVFSSAKARAAKVELMTNTYESFAGFAEKI